MHCFYANNFFKEYFYIFADTFAYNTGRYFFIYMMWNLCLGGNTSDLSNMDGLNVWNSLKEMTDIERNHILLNIDEVLGDEGNCFYWNFRTYLRCF